MKILIWTLVLLFFLGLQPQTASADAKASRSSALLATASPVEESDARVRILRSYLRQYDSPLEPYAGVFIREADANDLDWRLVVAISGVESTFGKHIPENSYNAWGWGIYGDNSMGFASYDEAIHVISTSLREQYIDKWKTKDVYAMGRIYAASPTWAERVVMFMNKIDKYSDQQKPETLSLSI